VNNAVGQLFFLKWLYFMSSSGNHSRSSADNINRKTPLLVFNDKGIYCPIADIYIDAWRPVDKCIITHGHSDHARYGHKHYLTHHNNVPIIKHRLGKINVKGIEWGEQVSVNGVVFSLHPAGHVIGSSQVRVEYKGEVWVFTGDYKLQDDGVCQAYESIPCHAMITECTFGLPAFNWRPQVEVMEDINTWWADNAAEGKTSIIFAYSLGKAQRILKHLNTDLGKIYTHGAIEKMTEVLRSIQDFPATELITRETQKKDLLGQIVIAPPSAHGSPWIRKMVPYETAAASGWMAFRGARRRRAMDRGFVLSDHCDWQGLLQAIESSGAEKVICTHGYTDIFSKYLRSIGLDARTEKTQFEGEVLESEKEAV
jgi:putative mRNA 3-end processing factor